MEIEAIDITFDPMTVTLHPDVLVLTDEGFLWRAASLGFGYPSQVDTIERLPFWSTKISLSLGINLTPHLSLGTQFQVSMGALGGGTG